MIPEIITLNPEKNPDVDVTVKVTYPADGVDGWILVIAVEKGAGDVCRMSDDAYDPVGPVTADKA